MASSTKANEDFPHDEEIFLAVVIADSYDKKLQPCTLNRPRVSMMSQWRVTNNDWMTFLHGKCKWLVTGDIDRSNWSSSQNLII